jgi:ATP-binding cassette, subfamily B, heavy metal transporter
MRSATALPKPPAGQPLQEIHIWQTVRTLFPYLWQYRFRVIAALLCLVAAKLANVGVPLIFKDMIDGLSGEALALPVMLLALYGALVVELGRA